MSAKEQDDIFLAFVLVEEGGHLRISPSAEK
jgi:hypothetical protein